jgi:hypothetical protein
MVEGAKTPERKRRVSIFLRLREFAPRRVAATIMAGAIAAGLLAIAATQRSTTSFIADTRTINHVFVRAAAETIIQALGFDSKVGDVRLERSEASHTLRATVVMVGAGVLDLQVNLARPGAVEHTGLLRARDIRVRRDSLAGDVLQKAEEHNTHPLPEQHSARPEFVFESIRVPFSIGHGLLILDDAVFSGQLANVTLRGKVDLRAHTINVSGTYLPMSGLPVSGMPTLLGGALQDGLFGVRFTTQGPLAKPAVIVNPMWLIPPGLIRKIFEMPAREEPNQ